MSLGQWLLDEQVQAAALATHVPLVLGTPGTNGTVFAQQNEALVGQVRLVRPLQLTLAMFCVQKPMPAVGQKHGQKLAMSKAPCASGTPQQPASAPLQWPGACLCVRASAPGPDVAQPWPVGQSLLDVHRQDNALATHLSLVRALPKGQQNGDTPLVERLQVMPL